MLNDCFNVKKPDHTGLFEPMSGVMVLRQHFSKPNITVPRHSPKQKEIRPLAFHLVGTP